MLFLATPRTKVSLKWKLYSVFIGASIMYLWYYIYGERIAYKLVEYSLPTSLESNSGLGPLVLSFVCSIIAIWFSEKRHRYLGFMFLLIQVSFYALTAFTYAGLRLQAMALFAQVLALFYCAKRPIKGGQLAIVILLCCLALSATARNFFVSAGEPSAFIPYHFAWESQ